MHKLFAQTEALCNIFKLFYVSAALWCAGSGGCWNNNRIPHLLKLSFKFLYWQAVAQALVCVTLQKGRIRKSLKAVWLEA